MRRATGKGGDDVLKDDASRLRGETPAGDRVLYADELLRVTSAERPGAPSVALVGEVDRTNSPALARVLREAAGFGGSLVIDAARLSFVDVSGVRVLLGLVREGAATVSGVPAQLRRLLAMLHQTL
ncbi:STAS domain-containing protein [Nonomuraea rhodomycinica]|uniref:STAS domain-containing protein n=1 Tax=Nonomuraea rhodomycinica TaxID=1712872 RepID=A0A7Y6IID5_9ACTN|nr:STAS domain-containing protein [Nonomuraea rhodomycinica]NUW38726.1 STAS domain-containing protein [Nonomuraea rhodomycinica]